MKILTLIPYEDKNSWEEALSLFLYIEIIKNNLTPDNFALENYHKFELYDDSIIEYNLWLSTDKKNIEKIHLLLENSPTLIEYFSNNFNNIFKPKVTFWRDRQKTAYFRNQLQQAFEFENFIAEKIKVEYGLDIEPFLTPEGQYELGENALGIEIKNDKILKKTRNVYIEVAEKSNKLLSDYTRSGILKSDNTIYFLIGDYEEFYIFFKATLVDIYREELKLYKQGKPSKRGIQFKQIYTSQGFVYPIANAVSDMISFDEMMVDIKKNKK